VKKTTIIRWLAIFTFFLIIVLLIAQAIHLESGQAWVAKPKITVEVDTNVPIQIQNALLHIHIYSPPPQEWEASGARSLKSPGGGGSSEDSATNIYTEGDELIAIKTNGFEIRFVESDYPILHTNNVRILQREKGYRHTSIVLFPYGKTTETNALGWKIVGKFQLPSN
jgi:hypothetical protein